MELDMAAHRPPACCLTLAITFLTAATLHSADPANYIQTYGKNPRYWQYKNEPVLLLGGSKTDHIFLAEELKEHLDEIATVGANYVRNTMSQREGVELKPHKRLSSGKFDLEQWNDDYWQRFADCLRWCHERDIIEADEAYLAALAGEKYLLYFTDGGSVTLDLTDHSRKFELRWINVSTGDWGATTTVQGGSKVNVTAPGKSGWVATIVR
jgi:hypothetical protein